MVVRPYKPLPRAFYKPSADLVAPELLGQLLLRHTDRGFCGGPIAEVEAYLFEDPASHSYVGETARNRSMYGPPGHAYVYFIYGNHYCVNAVTCPKGVGEAVLIRAIEAEVGIDMMRRRRHVTKETDLTNGPAKLCEALDIERSLDSADLCDAHSPLFIASNPLRKLWLQERGPIVRTTRIGISKGSESMLRFYATKSLFVSKLAREKH